MDAELSDALYSLVLVPPPYVVQPLLAIRAGLDPDLAAKTLPHVTLKQPFVIEPPRASHERALVRSLAAVCGRHRALRVQLDGVGFFASARHGCVVYLGVRAASVLHELAAALIGMIDELGHESPGLDADGERARFFPHLTLAQGLSTMAAESAVRHLAGLGAYEFVAHRVVVGRRDDRGAWQQPYEVELGRESVYRELN